MKRILLAILLFVSISQSWGQLNGTYTIGGGGTYANVVAAVADLNAQGVSGPVFFDIRPGIYTGQLTINNYSGASEANRVTFQPDTAMGADSTNAIIDNSGYVIFLNDGDYVTFDKLTINQNSTSSRTIYYDNTAENNIFSNCLINGANTTSTSNSYAVFYNGWTRNDGNVVRGCIIARGSYSFYWNGGGAGTNMEEGSVIENNIISGAYYRGFFTFYQKGLIFRNNNIDVNSSSCCERAMDIYWQDGSQFIGNKINSGDETWYMEDNYSSASTPMIIANNFITNTGSDDVFDIRDDNQYVNFYHNTVYTTNRISLLFFGSDNIAWDIKNNIFSTTNTNAIHVSNPSSEYSFDYNNILASGGNFVYWGGALSTLEDWQGTGNGMNSVSINPGFVGAPGDLHVTSGALGNLGMAIPSVTTDFDGDVRNTTNPDMGADEFDPTNTNDVAIMNIDTPGVLNCSNSNNIYVAIRNIGTATITSLSLAITINGTVVDTFLWTGSLATYVSSSANIGTFAFSDGDNLSVRAFNPNGLVDEDVSNNSVASIVYFPFSAGTYTVYGSSPDFTDLTLVTDKLNAGGVCSGPVIFDIREGLHNDEIDLRAIPGVSATNNVIFQSESGNKNLVFIAPSSVSGAIIDLNKTEYVTFRNLTIDLNPSSRDGIDVRNSNYNTFDNLVIIGNDGGDDGFYIYNSNYITISNNIITNTDDAIELYGVSSNNYSIGNVITMNTIDEFDRNGIYCDYNTDITISKNKIYTNDNSPREGLYLENGLSATVTQNDVRLFYGDDYAFYMEYFYGNPANKSIVAGNYFYTGADYSSAYLYENFFTTISNNTFVNRGIGSEYTVDLDQNGATYFKNNNIVNFAGGMACYFDIEYSPLESDHNNFYTTGNSLFETYDGSNTFFHSTVVDFSTAYGFDMNSLSVDPQFREIGDFHVCNDSLDMAGVSVDGVVLDLDGDLFSFTQPDIGADEFSPVSDGNILGDEVALCSGSSVILDAGPGATTYLWSNGVASQAITVVNPGVYTITVTGLCGMDITDDVLVTEVSSLTAAFDVFKGGQDLVFTDKSSGLPSSFVWDFGDGTSANGGIVSHNYPSPGSYIVTLIVSNECGADTTTQAIDVWAVGIDEIMEADVKVYPNPSIDGLFNIRIPNLGTKINIVVTNYLGQTIIATSSEVITGNQDRIINLSNASKGVYFLQIKSENKLFTKKLIIE